MVNNKWYIRCTSAEEDSYAVVQLTEDEYRAVVKFLSAEALDSSGFTGYCYIVNYGFDTKEEALDAILTNTVFLYSN